MSLPTPYYVDDHVVLLHGDCLALLPVLAERGLPWFGQERADHVITDPPYEAEAHTKARRSVRRPGPGGHISEAHAIDFAAIDEDTRDAVCDRCADLARRWVLVFCQVEAVGRWRSAMECSGLQWVRGQAWVKPDGSPQFTGDRPAQGFECIATAHVAATAMRWNGGGRRGVYSHCVNNEHGRAAVNHGTRTKVDHPTTKPLALMRELVRLFTDPGDLILDPFAGSGTTGLAARLEGRRALLIEREERYCRVAVERLSRMPVERADGQRVLFDGEDAA